MVCAYTGLGFVCLFSLSVYIKEKNFKPLFSPHVVSCFMDPLELERP